MSATTADSAAFSHDGEPVVFALEVVGGVFETIRLVVDREDADRPGLCAPGVIVGEVVRISADKRFVNGGLSVRSPPGTPGRVYGRPSVRVAARTVPRWIELARSLPVDSSRHEDGGVESTTPSPGVRR
jgi:hypothetical protein